MGNDLAGGGAGKNQDGGKFEIRNPKFETNPKFEGGKSARGKEEPRRGKEEVRNPRFGSLFLHLPSFEFVSNFDIRISDFLSAAAAPVFLIPAFSVDSNLLRISIFEFRISVGRTTTRKRRSSKSEIRFPFSSFSLIRVSFEFRYSNFGFSFRGRRSRFLDSRIFC